MVGAAKLTHHNTCMALVQQNYIKNCKEIINHIENNDYEFVSRDLKSFCGHSRFYSLYNENMKPELIDLIHSNLPKQLRICRDFIQIQKYNPGDYILPHTDNLQNISKLHLYTLTTSSYDGLTYQDGDKFVFIPDVAGQYIDFNLFSWHWVNPVRDTRYTMVIGE